MISVLMSVFNERLEWVKQAVDSMVQQTYLEIELIIIVDNPDINIKTKDYLREVETADNRVKILWNSVNLGLAKSLNKALNIASGKYIARMDADDISDCERLSKELKFLEDNDYDLVSANKINIDENGNVLAADPPVSREPSQTLQYSNIIVHPLVLVKTDVMKEMNGYRLLLNSEDFDLWLRIIDKGYKIGILHEYLLKYRIRKNSASIGRQLEQYYINKYVLRLMKERKRKGVDSFSQSNQEQYLKQCDFTEKKKKRLRRADELIKETLNYMGCKKIRQASICLSKAFITFPQYATEKIINQIAIFIKS